VNFRIKWFAHRSDRLNTSARERTLKANGRAANALHNRVVRAFLLSSFKRPVEIDAADASRVRTLLGGKK